MAFMFKGPASLTGASSVSSSGAITTSGNISTSDTGTITSAGALTVSAGGAQITGNSAIQGVSTLTVGGLLTASSGIQIGEASLTSINTGAGGPDAAVVASKSYVDQQINTVSGSGGETPTVVAPTGNVTTLSASATSGSRLFIINGSAYSGNSEMTFDVSAAPVDNSTWTFVWVKQSGGGTSPGVKIDFGMNKLVSASGANHRYLTIDDIGGSARVVYSTAGSVNQFFLIGGSGALLS